MPEESGKNDTQCKYPELKLPGHVMYNEPPNWDLWSNFTQGIVDYCSNAGFPISQTQASKCFIPECLQHLFMEWHHSGEFTQDSFVLGMLNGWMNEWRDLVDNGVIPDGLVPAGEHWSPRTVREWARRAFIRVRNHDDQGSIKEFKDLVLGQVKVWANEKRRMRDEAKAHKAALAKTVLVRLRRSDIEYIINRVDALVEPDGAPGFKDRVIACLRGDNTAALSGLE